MLMDAISSPYVSERREALHVLAAVDLAGDDIRDAVLARRTDPDRRVREAAAELVAMRGW
jgi:hypothetical protein